MAVKIIKQPLDVLTFLVAIKSTNIVAIQGSLSVELGEVNVLGAWTREPGCIVETNPYVGIVIMPGSASYSLSLIIPDTAAIKIYDVWVFLKDFSTGKQLAERKFLDEVQVVRPEYTIVSIGYV